MFMTLENLPQIPFPTAVHYHAHAYIVAVTLYILDMPFLCTFKFSLSNG